MTNDRLHADAVEAVEQIIHNLRDRKGLGDEWDAIDEDIQQEIRQEWIDIVINEFTHD